jgi:hypothetical protein
VTSWFQDKTRRKRSTGSDVVDGYVGFDMGVVAYRNLSDALPYMGPMAIYADPVLDPFDGQQLVVWYEERDLTILVRYKTMNQCQRQLTGFLQGFESERRHI